MNGNAGRLSILLFALVAFWIGVYWWWPVSDPGISAQPVPVEVDDTADLARDPRPPVTEVAPPVVLRGTSPTNTPTPTPAANPPAARPPQPAPAVVPPQFTEHTVQRGETFASIARKYYGNSRLSGAIARANPFVDPERLRPGRVIRVPKDPDNIQGVPAEPPTPQPPATATYSEYTVQRGDTLSGIAQRLYGDPSLASIIYQANRSSLRSEDDIKIGQVLKIPPKP